MVTAQFKELDGLRQDQMMPFLYLTIMAMALLIAAQSYLAIARHNLKLHFRCVMVFLRWPNMTGWKMGVTRMAGLISGM